MTEEEVVQSLNTSWMLVHDKWIQTWDQQIINDNQAQEEEWQNIQEQEDQLHAQKEQELESDWWEAEKKKLKMNSFNKDSMVHDFLTPRLLWLRKSRTALRQSKSKSKFHSELLGVSLEV